MARYIDADELLKDLKKQYGEELGWQCTVNMSDVGMMIEDATTADVVEVVRCKDCQNCEVIYPVKIIGYEPEEVYYCKAHNGSRNPKDFCSYGRRKDEISKATDS